VRALQAHFYSPQDTSKALKEALINFLTKVSAINFILAAKMQ
jgi:hypothetical protein